MVKGPERWFCKVSVQHGMQVSGFTKYLKGPVLELIFIQVPVVIINLWRPIFIIVQFVKVLWRELNCVKILQGETNKSANRGGHLRAKGGVVLPSVYNWPCSCAIKYISPTRLRCLFLLATNSLLYPHKTFMLSVPFHPPFQVWAGGGG